MDCVPSTSSGVVSRRVPREEYELYFLIAKFLEAGPFRNVAHGLISELDSRESQAYPHIPSDFLLQALRRLPELLERSGIPPTVPGLPSTFLGDGRQSLLRRETVALQRTVLPTNRLLSRRHGAPFFAPHNLRTPTNFARIHQAHSISGGTPYSVYFSVDRFQHFHFQRQTLGHISAVYCILYDRTGKYIFTGADDLLIKCWSATTGRLMCSFRGANGEISDIAINPENTLLAGASTDKCIRVWNLKTTEPVAVLTSHGGSVNAVKFCPAIGPQGTRFLISCSSDGSVSFFTYSCDEQGDRAQFSIQPEKFYERIRPGQASIICASFSYGGNFLATGSADHYVRVYNVFAQRPTDEGPVRILEEDANIDRVEGVEWARQSLQLVTGSKDGVAVVWRFEMNQWTKIKLRMDQTLAQERSTTSEQPSTSSAANNAKLKVDMVAWSGDDRYIISCSSDRTIKIWDPWDGRLLKLMDPCHTGEVFVLVAHPWDRRVFMTAGEDGKLVLWDVDSGRVLFEHINNIEGHGQGALFDGRWSPNGTQIAVTDSHGQLLLFGFGSREHFDYRKIPKDLFFHTDYRNLMRDDRGHVLDAITQRPPHLMAPPFLVDLDGNPYPPLRQRLVPARKDLPAQMNTPQATVDDDGQVVIVDDEDESHEGGSRLDAIIAQMIRAEGDEPDGPAPPGRREDAEESEQDGRERRRRNRLQRLRDRQARDSDAPLAPSAAPEPAPEPEAVVSVHPSSSIFSYFKKYPLIPPLPADKLKRIREESEEVSMAEMREFSRESLRTKPVVVINRPASEEILTAAGRLRNRIRRDQIRRHGYSMRGNDPVSEEDSRDAFQSTEENSMDGPPAGSSRGRSPSPPSRGSRATRRVPSPQANEGEVDWDDSEDVDWEEGLEDPWARGVRHALERRRQQAEERRRERDVRRRDREERGSRVRRMGRTRRRNAPVRRIVRPVVRQPRQAQEEDSNSSHSQPPRGGDAPGPSNEVSSGTEEEGELISPWFKMTKAKITPYSPQIGDEVVYFYQGHRTYLEQVQSRGICQVDWNNHAPWRKHPYIRNRMLVRIQRIQYVLLPPRVCRLKFSVITETGRATGQEFSIRYHDVPGLLDFLILKQQYDYAMEREWSPGDVFRCLMEGEWYVGEVVYKTPLDGNEPDSPFLCYKVRWRGDATEELLSPWDMEPLPQHAVALDRYPSQEHEVICHYVTEPSDWPFGDRESECQRIAQGIQQLMELPFAQAFATAVNLHDYPEYAEIIELPMDFGLIKARLENLYYRRMQAVIADTEQVRRNAEKFNLPDAPIVRHAAAATEVVKTLIKTPNCCSIRPLVSNVVRKYSLRNEDLTPRGRGNRRHGIGPSRRSGSGEEEQEEEGDEEEESGRRRRGVRTRQRTRREEESGSWMEACRELVDELWDNADSEPFRDPVDLDVYPDYLDVITRPLSLSVVRSQLNAGNHYRTIEEVETDIMTIFQNSRNYNTNRRSRIFTMTVRMEQFFAEKMRQLRARHSTSAGGSGRGPHRQIQRVTNRQGVSQIPDSTTSSVRLIRLPRRAMPVLQEEVPAQNLNGLSTAPDPSLRNTTTRSGRRIQHRSYADFVTSTTGGSEEEGTEARRHCYSTRNQPPSEVILPHAHPEPGPSTLNGRGPVLRRPLSRTAMSNGRVAARNQPEESSEEEESEDTSEEEPPSPPPQAPRAPRKRNARKVESDDDDFGGETSRGVKRNRGPGGRTVRPVKRKRLEDSDDEEKVRRKPKKGESSQRRAAGGKTDRRTRGSPSTEDEEESSAEDSSENSSAGSSTSEEGSTEEEEEMSEEERRPRKKGNQARPPVKRGGTSRRPVRAAAANRRAYREDNSESSS
ncbi:unnamed protein product [Cyprideis torosa]|uniref:Uncharacterized protein n=1 Tax=Cyprideis torosa TaxID=163714 RepID=A0A7R8WI44_9CRUS|nr:unnamed protein product [Cyprideis torosa]CAG0900264.1 unnamed protein product [Cyprideis torosa]